MPRGNSNPNSWAFSGLCTTAFRLDSHAFRVFRSATPAMVASVG